MAAAQAQHRCATDSGGGCGESASDRDALAVASAVSLCLLHDLVGVALFLASHPLHAVYLLIFARGLVSLAAFFWPLLASTSLLLAVLATVGPYVGSAEWHGVRSFGRTCGIAIAALCAEHGPDGTGAGMVGQICSFVLGPTDAASILRVEEIMGEPCDITACCFLLEEEKSLSLLGGNERKEPAFALPLMGGVISNRSFLGYEDLCDLKDEVDEKVVISEDLKGSVCLAQQCCPSVTVFVQETDAEEEENGIQRQCLILSAIEFSDDVEKRLECDPVSVEIKKSQPAQVSEIKKLELVETMEAKKLDSKKCNKPVQAVQMKKSEPVESMKIEKSELVESVETKNSKLVQELLVKIFEPVQELEVKNYEPVEPLEIRKSGPIEPVEIKNRERVKLPSLIAQRIKLWEAQAFGNIKPVFEDKEDDSVEFNFEKELFRDVKNSVRFEAAPCIEKYNSEHQAQEVACNEESTKEQSEQEFNDPNEYTRSETEISSEKCSQNNENEQIAVTAAKADEELQEDYKDEQPEPELQQQAHLIEQAEQELQEMEVYTDVTSSPATWIESPLKSTSIAGRVHSRNSSENLVSVGSPSQKDKEWKRTLACKLYEERMQIRLCRDRAVVEGSDNMDMLWEAYEVGSGGGRGRVGKRSGSKDKGGDNKVEELVNEGLKEEEGDDDEEEGSVRHLCCLQALKFSTRKMNFGGSKPSLSKISKVLRRMTALSRMGSRRKPSE